MRGIDQVIDYPARDMTITVQAGITIAKLNEILRGENQRLAVEVPLPDRATLGGAIAANASGPRRFGLGTLRDYVIGISVVNDLGQEVKAGGRVVKNVAGYDLMKLYTGSLGTLGIISQATLKLKPLSAASSLLVLPATLERLSAVLDMLNDSKTRPVCIELLDPRAIEAIGGNVSGSAWNLLIGYEDNAPSVAWQIQQLTKELPGDLRNSLQQCTPAEEAALWTKLTDFALWPDAQLTFKANLLPSATADFCKRASSLTPAPMAQAHAGHGIVYGHVRDLTIEQARSMLEVLGTAAATASGNLIVTRCPAAWKSVLPIWGRPSGDRILMKAIKAKLDPGNIFNPGRFVDGI
jgi:glycolate oxidase FAD binding subunit